MPRISAGCKLARSRAALIAGVKSGKSPAKISQSLKEIGVTKTPRQVSACVYLLREKGLIPRWDPKNTKTGRIREMLAANPGLTNREIALELVAAGMETKASDVWKLRKAANLVYTHRGQLMAKTKPYPKLTPLQLTVLNASLKPLRGVVYFIATESGITNRAKIDDFHSFCLERLPRWIPRISKGLKQEVMKRQLVARLKPRVKFALRHFRCREIAQTTGLTEQEVQLGWRVKKRLRQGQPIDKAAEAEGVDAKEAEEIVRALNMAPHLK